MKSWDKISEDVESGSACELATTLLEYSRPEQIAILTLLDEVNESRRAENPLLPNFSIRQSDNGDKLGLWLLDPSEDEAFEVIDVAGRTWREDAYNEHWANPDECKTLDIINAPIRWQFGKSTQGSEIASPFDKWDTEFWKLKQHSVLLEPSEQTLPEEVSPEPRVQVIPEEVIAKPEAVENNEINWCTASLLARSNLGVLATCFGKQ